MSLCWLLCILVATVTSITNEASLWQICSSDDHNISFQILMVKDDNFCLPILKFIFLYIIPLLLIALIYTRIYLAAKANSEKLRINTSFNCSLESSNLSSHVGSYEDLRNGKAPSIGARRDTSVTSEDLRKCPPQKAYSTDTIALDGDLMLQSRSGSFTQRLARSASNASTTLISNIRKRVLATHNFIRVCIFSSGFFY